jgi:hypothetical protein
LLFRAWTLINIRPCPHVGTCHIGRGRRQSLIGLDWRRRGDKIGETPCRSSRDENAGNGESQADHFFTFSASSTK